jgi:hypothetical protein
LRVLVEVEAITSETVIATMRIGTTITAVVIATDGNVVSLLTLSPFAKSRSNLCGIKIRTEKAPLGGRFVFTTRSFLYPWQASRTIETRHNVFLLWIALINCQNTA